MFNPENQVEPELIPPLDPSMLYLTDEETTFLRDAISVSEDELKRRILDVQKRAYEKYPYPCIRAFHFVNLMMASNPIYPTVLEAGKAGDTLLLDLGCCMGTDVRKIARDGYPTTQILGCDLRPEYIAAGYELFGDADTCPIRFFASNVFDLPASIESPELQPSPEVGTKDLASITDLSQLRGALTHIYTGALFHLFDQDTQYGLALRLALLLKRNLGAVVFGRHQGVEKEGYIRDHLGRNRYGHSEQSWTTLWKEVFAQIEGEAFAEKVVVHAKLTEGFTMQVFHAKVQTHMLYWSVQIV